jgi:hypothetical protein
MKMLRLLKTSSEEEKEYRQYHKTRRRVGTGEDVLVPNIDLPPSLGPGETNTNTNW